MSLSPLRLLFLTLLLSWDVWIPPAFAQISADVTTNTLVTPSASTFTITGGTASGPHLFHSFSDFSVPTGTEAFFDNSTTITNIFSRVTGGNVSNIDGVIRANGTANLFLINPAGIIFGENATLNLGGSFFASTAESLRFSDDLDFSATQPGSPPLLTVNLPIGLQFGDQAQPIASLSELTVGNGQNLTFLGGDILLADATLRAPQGSIKLGSVGPQSFVELRPTPQQWTLDYGAVTQFQDISLSQGTLVSATGNGGGSINLNANTITVDDSFVEVNSLGTQDDGVVIHLTATDTIQLLNGGQVYSEASATGQGGSLQLQAPDLRIQGTGTFGPSLLATAVLPGAITNAGAINIQVENLQLLNGALVFSVVQGQGDAGAIDLQAQTIEINSQNSTGISFLTSQVFSNGRGNGGDINIDTQTLRLLGGGQITAPSFGQGNGGSVNITASEIELIGTNPQNGVTSLISSALDAGGTGNAGSINLHVDQLTLLEGAQIINGTFGQGNGGPITVQATDIELHGVNPVNGAPSGIFAVVDPGAIGNAGSLDLQVDQLKVLEGAQISNGTFGQGNGGPITIQATDVELRGINPVNSIASGIFTSVNPGGIGNAGSIHLNVGQLTALEGAQVFNGTSGQGDGGPITVQATDVELRGVNPVNGNPSGILASVNPDARGNAGSINLQVDQLKAVDGAQIFNGTFGQGNGGPITVQATDVELRGTNPVTGNSSGIFASVDFGGMGDAGSINLQVDQLRLWEGAQIFNGTFGQGNGGSLTIQSTNLELREVSPLTGIPSVISTSVDSEGIGNSGTIDIVTDQLLLADGSQIGSTTFGNGNGGSIAILAQDINLSGRASNDVRSGIFSQVSPDAVGHAGNITLSTHTLNLTEGARISNGTLGQGNAGDLDIDVNQTLQITGVPDLETPGGIASLADTNFAAGTVNIRAQDLILDQFGTISVRAVNGAAGDITITTEQDVLINQSMIDATTDSGNGGNLTFNIGRTLQLRENSQITTTAGLAGARGDGGNIIIDAPLIVGVADENSDISANAFDGTGGSIQINTEGIFGIAPRNRPTPESDITASSERGIDFQGTVTLNIDNPDPGTSLVELPATPINLRQVISQSCLPPGGRALGLFRLVGKGGLAATPETHPLTLFGKNPFGEAAQVAAPLPKRPHPVQEATGFFRLEDGAIALTHCP